MNILPNQVITLSPFIESRDTGWVISGQFATHYPCNAGTMYSVGSQGVAVGKTYIVTYEVLNYISGGVRVAFGNSQGTLRTANGVYTEAIQCTGSPKISFYSDGYLTINKNFKFYEQVDQQDNSITVSFYDGEGQTNKKWSSRWSYSPEMMIKFVNSFFTIKNGALWQHNVNEVRNNFYGVQYKSQVQFFSNFAPTTVKIFYSIRVQGNNRWFAPNNGDLNLPAVEGRSLGMSSRLKRNNFKNYQGSFYADFMRNYFDSRFNDPEQALFKGEPLRGRYLSVLLTNDDTTESILFEVDVKTASAPITY